MPDAVLRLELAAVAFDERALAEDLADDAAQQPLDRGVLERREGLDGGHLVGVREVARLLRDAPLAELRVELEALRRAGRAHGDLLAPARRVVVEPGGLGIEVEAQEQAAASARRPALRAARACLGRGCS